MDNFKRRFCSPIVIVKFIDFTKGNLSCFQQLSGSSEIRLVERHNADGCTQRRMVSIPNFTRLVRPRGSVCAREQFNMNLLNSGGNPEVSEPFKVFQTPAQ